MKNLRFVGMNRYLLAGGDYATVNKVVSQLFDEVGEFTPNLVVVSHYYPNKENGGMWYCSLCEEGTGCGVGECLPTPKR